MLPNLLLGADKITIDYEVNIKENSRWNTDEAKRHQLICQQNILKTKDSR